MWKSLRNDKIGFAERIELLEGAIDDFEKDNGYIYKEYFLQELRLVPKSITEDKLFIQRNKRMVNAIDNLIGNNSLFIMVGVAHLPGKDGILNLLHKKGYTLANVDIELSTNIISK